MILILICLSIISATPSFEEFTHAASDETDAFSDVRLSETGGGTFQVDFLVTFETLPAGLNLSIDGIEYVTPVEFVWQDGESHLINALSPQSAGNDTCYAWSSWNDGGTQTHPIVITDNRTYTAYYDTMYLVTVDSTPIKLEIWVDGIPQTLPIQFWARTGHLMIMTAPTEVYVGNLTRYVFVGWFADPLIPFPLTEPSINITIGGPQYLAAVYALQYCLFYEGLSLPTNCEWYDNGTIAYASLDSPYRYSGPNIRAAFVHWAGDVTGGNYSRSDPILMDGPKFALTVWLTQYNISFATSPVGLDLEVDGTLYDTSVPLYFWWDAGSPHHLHAPDHPPDIWFSHWSDGGDQAHVITANAPNFLIAYYSWGHEVIVTTDPLLPRVDVDGQSYDSPAVFRWGNATSHTIAAPLLQFTPNGSYHFSHWSDGLSRVHTIVVTGPTTYTAFYTRKVNVTIGSMPTGVEVHVDGVPYITPMVFEWEIGSVHSIEAEEWIVSGPNGVLRFSYWSDGGAKTHSITIDRSDSFVAFYDIYYRMVIDTKPSGLNFYLNGSVCETPATFWWKDGSSHDVEAMTPQEYNGTRYYFIRWEDGVATKKRIIVVSGPEMYTVIFRAKYYLEVTIIDPPMDVGPIVIGNGWYDEGSYAVLGLLGSEFTYDNGWRRWNFLYWGGDASGTDYRASEPILMDRPRKVLVLGKMWFRIEVDSWPSGRTIEVEGVPVRTPASFWVEGGSSLYLQAREEALGPGERYALSFWGGGDFEEDGFLRVTDAGRYVAFFSHQYYLTIESEYGSPIGEGWHDAGSTVSIAVQTKLHVGEKVCHFRGWSGDITSSSPQMTITVDSPMHLTASWEVTEEPSEDTWPLLYGVTVTILVTVFIIAFSFRWVRSKMKRD